MQASADMRLYCALKPLDPIGNNKKETNLKICTTDCPIKYKWDKMRQCPIEKCPIRIGTNWQEIDIVSKMYIYCFQLSISALKHLKMVFTQSKHFERHVLCYMWILTGYTFYLFNCLLIYLFLIHFNQFVFGLSLTLFQICINRFTTSRIAFIHHIFKQIFYCYILLSDFVH